MLRVVCGSNLFPDVISRGGEENPAAVRESGSFHSSIQSHLKGHSMAAKEKTRVPVRLELLQPALLQIPYDRSHNRRVSTAQALFKPFSCLPRYFLASPAQRDVGETFVWTEAPKMGVSVLCNQVARAGQQRFRAIGKKLLLLALAQYLLAMYQINQYGTYPLVTLMLIFLSKHRNKASKN